MKIYNYLQYENCILRLDEVESKFLKSSLEKDNSIKNIVKTVRKLLENSTIRHFDIDHIGEISINLKNKINEEVARDNKTVKYASEPEKIKRSISTDPITGKFILSLEDKDLLFNDQDSAIIYARNNNLY